MFKGLEDPRRLQQSKGWGPENRGERDPAARVRGSRGERDPTARGKVLSFHCE